MAKLVVFFLSQGSTGSSILSGDGDAATERWITASDEDGIRKTVGTGWCHWAQFMRNAYSSFDAQGKTIDSEGKLVWNVEELCDERLVVTIMSAPALISSGKNHFSNFNFHSVSTCHSGVALF